jgi:hypothetical protein
MFHSVPGVPQEKMERFAQMLEASSDEHAAADISLIVSSIVAQQFPT